MTRLLVTGAVWLLAFAAPLAVPVNGQPSMDPELQGGRSDQGKDHFGVRALSSDRPKDAKTEITARKEATFDNASDIAEFMGSVVVKDPQFTLYCDRLKVTLNRERKGLKLVEAFGNVIIVQENKDESGKQSKATGRSGKVVYEPVSGNIVLTVWPSVQHDINLQVATEEGTVMTLNRSGKMTTKGGSKTLIVDNSQQGL